LPFSANDIALCPSILSFSLFLLDFDSIKGSERMESKFQHHENDDREDLYHSLPSNILGKFSSSLGSSSSQSKIGRNEEEYDLSSSIRPLSISRQTSSDHKSIIAEEKTSNRLLPVSPSSASKLSSTGSASKLVPSYSSACSAYSMSGSVIPRKSLNYVEEKHKLLEIEEHELDADEEFEILKKAPSKPRTIPTGPSNLAKRFISGFRM
jgi:hypothetical protein